MGTPNPVEAVRLLYSAKSAFLSWDIGLHHITMVRVLIFRDKEESLENGFRLVHENWKLLALIQGLSTYVQFHLYTGDVSPKT